MHPRERINLLLPLRIEVDVIEDGEDNAGISGILPREYLFPCFRLPLVTIVFPLIANFFILIFRFSDANISFFINLFPDGNWIRHQAAVQDDPKFLHPYDRTSESLFLVVKIPKTFSSVSEYTKSFVYPLLEETHADCT